MYNLFILGEESSGQEHIYMSLQDWLHPQNVYTRPSPTPETKSPANLGKSFIAYRAHHKQERKGSRKQYKQHLDADSGSMKTKHEGSGQEHIYMHLLRDRLHTQHVYSSLSSIQTTEDLSYEAEKELIVS